VLPISLKSFLSPVMLKCGEGSLIRGCLRISLDAGNLPGAVWRTDRMGGGGNEKG